MKAISIEMQSFELMRSFPWLKRRTNMRKSALLLFFINEHLIKRFAGIKY